jgi:hypothetical protein
VFQVTSLASTYSSVHSAHTRPAPGRASRSRAAPRTPWSPPAPSPSEHRGPKLTLPKSPATVDKASVQTLGKLAVDDKLLSKTPDHDALYGD